MPQMPSIFSSVAPGLGGQANSLDPRLLQLAMQAIPGMGASQGMAPSPVPPSRQMTPPTNNLVGGGPSQVGPPSLGVTPPSQQSDPGMQDRVQRVVMLMMQNMQLMLPFFAGIGAGVLLDQMGKPPMVKPHRSNEELAASGVPVGNDGQTGMPDPAMMERSLQVPMPRRM